MAKRKGPNMSEAVRELLAKDPNMKAKEIVDTLAKTGLKVNPNLIYFLKGKAKATKQRKTRVVKAARAASRNGATSDPIALIREVKSLADKAGGFGKLKELVEALAE